MYAAYFGPKAVPVWVRFGYLESQDGSEANGSQHVAESARIGICLAVECLLACCCGFRSGGQKVRFQQRPPKRTYVILTQRNRNTQNPNSSPHESGWRCRTLNAKPLLNSQSYPNIASSTSHPNWVGTSNPLKHIRI